MKIIVLNDRTDNVGGVEVYCNNLKRWLEQNGDCVKFIGSKGYREKHISFMLSFFNIYWLIKISKEILSYKPDLIHAHSVSERISPSVLVASTMFKVPVIITLPNYYHYICPKGTLINKKNALCELGFSWNCILSGCTGAKGQHMKLLSWLRLGFHRIFFKKFVNKFISPSKNLADYVSQSLNRDDICVVPNPIFLNQKQSSVTFNSRSSDENIKILYVGRLESEKGCSTLIEALNKLIPINPQLILHIVGTGKEEKKLIDQTNQLKLQKHVIFHGFMEHKDILDLYKDATILVLPSLCIENHPLVVIEALINGLPVVASNLGGQTEIIHEGINGYLFQAGNISDMVHKISLAINDSTMRDRVAQEAPQYAKEFSADVHFKRVYQVYQDLLSQKENCE